MLSSVCFSEFAFAFGFVGDAGAFPLELAAEPKFIAMDIGLAPETLVGEDDEVGVRADGDGVEDVGVFA